MANTGSAASCANVTAAILAGGLGTRLRSVLAGVPKVLAPVGARPFIGLLLDQLVSAGVKKTVLLTGYGSEQVRATLGEEYRGMRLAYSEEPSPLGTAGAVRKAAPRLDSTDILLMNGDSFCELDFHRLVTDHHRRRADVTLALKHVSDTSRFGQVTINAKGKVIRFDEKRGHRDPGWINAGVYVLTKSILKEIPHQPCSLERDLLPMWACTRAVHGYMQTGRFLDIGTPSSYAEAAPFFRKHQ